MRAGAEIQSLVAVGVTERSDCGTRFVTRYAPCSVTGMSRARHAFQTTVTTTDSRSVKRTAGMLDLGAMNYSAYHCKHPSTGRLERRWGSIRTRLSAPHNPFPRIHSDRFSPLKSLVLVLPLHVLPLTHSRSPSPSLDDACPPLHNACPPLDDACPPPDNACPPLDVACPPLPALARVRFQPISGSLDDARYTLATAVLR